MAPEWPLGSRGWRATCRGPIGPRLVCFCHLGCLWNAAPSGPYMKTGSATAKRFSPSIVRRLVGFRCFGVPVECLSGEVTPQSLDPSIGSPQNALKMREESSALGGLSESGIVDMIPDRHNRWACSTRLQGMSVGFILGWSLPLLTAAFHQCRLARASLRCSSARLSFFLAD